MSLENHEEFHLDPILFSPLNLSGGRLASFTVIQGFNDPGHQGQGIRENLGARAIAVQSGQIRHGVEARKIR